MARPEFGGKFGDPGGERDDGDSHACDRLTRVCQAAGSGERNERLAVGAGGGQERLAIAVGLLYLVNGSVVVAVLGVEQAYQDARVEDQRLHSSRSRSSSPGR